MATKKQTSTAIKQPIAIVPKKKVNKKKLAAKKPVVKKPAARTAKKKPSAATKKTHEPVVAVERVTVYTENTEPRGGFTLVHVGELYLVSIFLALVILGIVYWAVALSNTVQWAQTLSASSQYIAEHALRLAAL